MECAKRLLQIEFELLKLRALGIEFGAQCAGDLECIIAARRVFAREPIFDGARCAFGDAAEPFRRTLTVKGADDTNNLVQVAA